MPFSPSPPVCIPPLCHTLPMKVLGQKSMPLPQMLPSAQGLAAARVHQATAAALAAVSSTGIAKGVYRFATHEEMNRADEEALVWVIRQNLQTRKHSSSG